MLRCQMPLFSVLRIVALAAFVLPWGALGGTDQEPQDSAAREERALVFYREGQAALERADHVGFLKATRQALSLLPREPTLLVDLARAAALAGERDRSLDALERIAALGLHLDLDVAAFDAVRQSPAFDPIKRRISANAAPAGTSQVAFRLEETDFLPEGIAHDPTTGTFYVSSVRRRKVVAVREDGRVRDFTRPGQDGLMAVLGIGVDAPRRRLWASSTALPQMDGYQEGDLGRAALFCFDLDSGRLLARWLPPDPATRHNINDLVIGPKGEVYVSDSRSGELYRAHVEAEHLEVLVPPGHFRSPNGLVLLPDAKSLLVADYSRGLALVDTSTGVVRPVAPPEDALLSGIDGLVRVGATIVAVQNGLEPHRVLALRLDATQECATDVRLLARSHPDFDEPTLGVVVGSDLFFVANSQWGAYDSGGRITAPERIRSPTILRLRVD